MRILSTLSLFLSLSVILAHSVFPHHHHKAKTEQASHDEEHHHELSNGHHHHDDSDDHHHGLFTYTQIENIFLTGKQVAVPMVAPTVIEIFEWSFVAANAQGKDNFYRNDIELPPLLRCKEISFRGPPII